MNESSRMRAVQSPIIPVVAELIRTHPGTISLGQGVVSYGPPRQAIEQIESFLSDTENHKYKPVHGITSLREAIEQKLLRENGIRVTNSRRVVVTAGGNMAFMNAVLAIADAGDEIILLAPYYFNHEMAVAMANCLPVIVQCDDHFQPRLDEIRTAITPRTRAIVTISPNNPSGAVYPESTLREINKLCRDKGICHINDEAYEHFTYGSARHFSPASLSNAAEHTISLFSLSKSYGFASWRIGYMLVPFEMFEAIRKIQDTILICPPVISQCAAVGALAAGRAFCERHLASLSEVRSLVAGELLRLKDRCTLPAADGAFYFLLRLHAQMSSMELVERLIKEHGVAVIPGTTFGLNDGCYVRLSYGPLNKESAATGIERFVRGIESVVRR